MNDSRASEDIDNILREVLNMESTGPDNWVKWATQVKKKVKTGFKIVGTCDVP